MTIKKDEIFKCQPDRIHEDEFRSDLYLKEEMEVFFEYQRNLKLLYSRRVHVCIVNGDQLVDEISYRHLAEAIMKDFRIVVIHYGSPQIPIQLQQVAWISESISGPPTPKAFYAFTQSVLKQL